MIPPSASAVAFVAAAYAIARLHIEPLRPFDGSHQGPVPILFWSAVLLWALVHAKLTGVRPSAVATYAIGVGVAVQLLLGLSAARLEAASDPTFFDNRAFDLYFRAVYALVLLTVTVVITSAVVVPVARDAVARRVRNAVAWASLPVAITLLVVVGEAAAHRLWLDAGGVLAFAALTALLRARLVPRTAAVVSAVAGIIHGRQWVLVVGAAAVLFVFVVAFNIGLVRQTGAAFPTASDDGDFYDDLGWALATNTQYRTFPQIEATWSFRSPGYPFFVAIVYKLFGRDFVALGAMQAVLGASIPWAVYLIGRRAFDARVGILAAVLTASSGLLVSVLATLRSEALYAVVSAWLVVALVVASRARSARTFGVSLLATGALLSYGVMVKPQMLGFIPVAALLLAWQWRRAGATWGRVVLGVGIAAAALLLVFAPLAARDVAVNGRLTVLGVSHSGETWVANFVGARLAELGAERPDPALLMTALRAHPAEFVTVIVQEMPHNIRDFFAGWWFGKGDPLLLQRFTDYAHTMNVYGYAASLLGLVVAWRWLVGDAAARANLLAYLAVNVGIVVLVAYPSARYRIPLDPLLFIWTAAGLIWIGRRVVRAAGEIRLSS